MTQVAVNQLKSKFGSMLSKKMVAYYLESATYNLLSFPDAHDKLPKILNRIKKVLNYAQIS